MTPSNARKSAHIFWFGGANMHAAWLVSKSRERRGLPTKGWAAGTVVFMALPILAVFVFVAWSDGQWEMVLVALAVIGALAAVATLLSRPD